VRALVELERYLSALKESGELAVLSDDARKTSAMRRRHDRLEMTTQCRIYNLSTAMQTVVETPPYLADAERILTGEERMAIVDQVASDPRCGVVVPGSGGIRKLRSASGTR